MLWQCRAKVEVEAGVAENSAALGCWAASEVRSAHVRVEMRKALIKKACLSKCGGGQAGGGLAVGVSQQAPAATIVRSGARARMSTWHAYDVETCRAWR